MKHWMWLVSTLVLCAAPSTAEAAGGGRWADKVIFDPMVANMMLVYLDNDAPSAEQLSFASVDVVQYVPAYEGRIEEASLLMVNGSQVLFSMGPRAGQDAVLIAAILGQRPMPMSPTAADRIVPAGVSEGGPAIILGAVDNETAMQPLSTSIVEDAMFADFVEGGPREEVAYPTPPGFVDATDDTGDLERSAIELGLRSKMETFRNCYQRQIQRTPNLPGGKVTVQFLINTDGIVERARIERTSLQNDDVERCLIQNLEGTQFPIPRNGGTVVVSYPFSFTRR